MANPPDLSPQVLQQLRAQMDAALAAPHATVMAAAAAAPTPTDFCSLWPTVKPILQALVGIIGLIPGFGPAAGAALTALLTIGDQIYKTCPVK
jgi:hypothetical protein